MADWASLLNSPPPGTLQTICECEGMLMASNDLRGLNKVAEVVDHLPVADLGLQDPKIGHKLGGDSTFLSAKQAFLQPSESKHLNLASNQGLYKAIEDWLAQNEEKWWLLKIFTGMTLFPSILKPKIPPEDLMATFSNTREFKSAPVKCIAWHPHVAKLALAMKDDAVQIVLTTSAVKPLLKHKKQKQICCLAWRPFSASELAVGCGTGVIIWTVDPISVVARPSAACVSLLSEELKNHQPVTSLAWNPQGSLLLTGSAADNTMYVWNTATEMKVPLKRIGGGGVQLVSWSPQGSAVLAATTSTVFRIWNTSEMWQPERWSILSGHINNACWSPCGTVLLFTTTTEAQIFCLRFSIVDENNTISIQSAGAAVPVMDLAKVTFNDYEEVGGQVLGMKWDPSGERLVVSFTESNLMALFCTRVTPTSVGISPLGFIRGDADECPTLMEFAKHYKGGALLSIIWSSGRLQHFPMFFLSNLNQVDQLAPCLLSSSPANGEFAPRIFSSSAF